MTDKPQELRKLDSVRAINKLMIDAEIKVGHREQHIDYIVQEILDWHNKQMSELLDRLAIEVRASDYIGIAETIQSERNKLTMANSPQLDKLKERDDE